MFSIRVSTSYNMMIKRTIERANYNLISIDHRQGCLRDVEGEFWSDYQVRNKNIHGVSRT
jgi:hypothetical protein